MEFVTNLTWTKIFNNLLTQKTRKLQHTYICDKTTYIACSYSKPSSNIINKYRKSNAGQKYNIEQSYCIMGLKK